MILDRFILRLGHFTDSYHGSYRHFQNGKTLYVRERQREYECYSKLLITVEDFKAT